MNETTAGDGSPGRVVLVEDDPAFRGVLTLLFKSAGWTVVGARDGKVGLELARCLSPDVVVTDLRMPGMSGIQLAEQITLMAVDRQPPVVAITSDSSNLRDAALQSGLFTEVLTKPFAPQLLLETVRQALRGKRSD